jgi:exodeoxyribonuclease III
MVAPLKIASWNINSVRFRLGIVEQFLTEQSPDILCLQETKAMNDVFPASAFAALGYTSQHLNGQPMHHGVAILSRIPLVDDERLDWQANSEARHIGVRLADPVYGGLRLENVYVPAGGDVPDRTQNPKFGQKLDFLERMIDWSGALRAPTLIVGDFNIAPLPEDVWSHKALLDVVSHTQIEVATLGRLQAAGGWIDLGRHFHPAPARLHTWWSYRAKDWAASDRGRRLDHMWATPDVAARAVTHRVHETCRSWERPSDHVPLVTEFVF